MKYVPDMPKPSSKQWIENHPWLLCAVIIIVMAALFKLFF